MEQGLIAFQTDALKYLIDRKFLDAFCPGPKKAASPSGVDVDINNG